MFKSVKTRSLAQKARRLDAHGLHAMFSALVHTPEQWETCRHRLYDPAQTFWMFLEQTLCADKSCTQAVAKGAVRRAANNQAAGSPGTGAYCKARKRLPLKDLDRLNESVIERAHGSPEPAPGWKGRRVRIVDGSTVSMPDTPENQALYPQPSGASARMWFSHDAPGGDLFAGHRSNNGFCPRLA